MASPPQRALPTISIATTSWLCTFSNLDNGPDVVLMLLITPHSSFCYPFKDSYTQDKRPGHLIGIECRSLNKYSLLELNHIFILSGTFDLFIKIQSMMTFRILCRDVCPTCASESAFPSVSLVFYALHFNCTLGEIHASHLKNEESWSNY